ncbi:WHG domain-containing protein [Acinetobacter sp. NIPH 2699]|uniref:TetR-like C-terminal domain-containing protein n=1 Tax=Acinetobacter sp. NIPH 2699 TaxID=2923433 RepID=UPI001F4AFC91|nr:WHG domain-containing protein [Acinetobacter sp. NIPH 2699]MCH7336363.1 WHG domain-containing protein [Acinetobacter sp. NIPH 2699]
MELEATIFKPRSDVGIDDVRVITFSAQAWSLVHGVSVLLLNGQFQHITENVGELIDSIFKNQMTLV